MIEFFTLRTEIRHGFGQILNSLRLLKKTQKKQFWILKTYRKMLLRQIFYDIH